MAEEEEKEDLSWLSAEEEDLSQSSAEEDLSWSSAEKEDLSR